MRRPAPLALLAALLLPAGAGAAAPTPAPAPAPAIITAVRCGRLIDVRKGVVVAGAVVLVQDGRIRAVGPDVAVPAGARVLDLGTATCLPGLIDAHTHLLSDFPLGTGDQQSAAMVLYTRQGTVQRALRGAALGREMLEAGFTTVRDLGNCGEDGDVALRDAIAAGWVEGPRMAVSTRALAPIGGQFHGLSPAGTALVAEDYVEVTGVAEVRRAVRRAVAAGADLIKVIVNDGAAALSLEELRALVDEAHRAGRKVAAHAVGAETTALAVEAGVDSIEHGYIVEEETLRRMAEKRVYLVPTDFTIDDMEQIVRRPDASPDEIKLDRAYLGRLAAMIRERLALAVKLGVPIAAGSDAYYDLPGKTRGQAARQMFRVYAGSGLTPLQILRAATLDAADLLGWSDRVGSLEPGRYADLIAVPGDPLADAGQLDSVAFVMKGGAVVRNAVSGGGGTPRPRARTPGGSP